MFVSNMDSISIFSEWFCFSSGIICFFFSPSSHYDLTVVIAVATYGFPLQTHTAFDHLSRQGLYSDGSNTLVLSCLSLSHQLKGLSTSHYELKQHEALNRSLASQYQCCDRRLPILQNPEPNRIFICHSTLGISLFNRKQLMVTYKFNEIIVLWNWYDLLSH